MTVLSTYIIETRRPPHSSLLSTTYSLPSPYSTKQYDYQMNKRHITEDAPHSTPINEQFYVTTRKVIC